MAGSKGQIYSLVVDAQRERAKQNVQGTREEEGRETWACYLWVTGETLPSADTIKEIKPHILLILSLSLFLAQFIFCPHHHHFHITSPTYSS